MSSLSIRGIDPQLATLLKEQAKKSHKSINQFVLETLRQRVGLLKEKHFTKKYDLVQGKIDGEQQIDAELWK